MGKISSETKEFYTIFKEVGEFSKGGTYEEFTGDWETDKEEFSKKFQQYKREMKKIKTDTDEV